MLNATQNDIAEHDLCFGLKKITLAEFLHHDFLFYFFTNLIGKLHDKKETNIDRKRCPCHTNVL